MIIVPKFEMPVQVSWIPSCCDREGRLAAIGDVADDSQEEEEVQFDVAKRLFHLIALEMLILHARLVLSQPLDSHSLLSRTQSFRRDRTIRQEDSHHNPPDTTQRADDDELILPTR